MNHKPLFAAAAVALLLAGCQSMPMNTTATPVVESVKPVKAVQSEDTLLKPMMEQREAFVATGYAVISVQSPKTPAQKRLMAIRASKLDAYRALVEQVYGQYLDANTTVADMTVMNDTFRAHVNGVIYGAKLVSINPVGNDTYETTLSLDRTVVNDIRALYIKQMNAGRRLQ
jgi:hypothetical protein